ncbi:MAG: glycosyltransferase family 2 protein [Butyricicoccus sp.]|nr:glycosyltransferase family 2 protein [Butyricicoccus sp.]
MNKQTKPVLSIGMIVKNEEQKLEKCLKALQPLRDAVPCELVIADTGSTDGTRAIAERYADLVFDFPWVNDFAAARNAVMDKCTGLWYLTVDADEYLDADVSELVSFLTSASAKKTDVGYVIVRNYNTADMVPGDCNDFFAFRMVRMAMGIRYHGSVHEAFSVQAGQVSRFFHATILHHDGYAWRTQDNAREKLQRNLDLLEAEIQKHPHNARILMECIESSNFEEEKRRKYSQMAMDLLKNGPIEEAIFAPVLARSACMAAAGERYPEAAEWIAFAQEHFPDSAFIRVDVSFAAALQAHHDRDSAKVIQAGERYKAEWHAFSQDPDLQAKTLYLSPLQWVKAVDQQIIDLLLSEAYARTGQPETAWKLLRGWEFSPATPEVLADWVRTMTLLEHIPGAEEEVLRVFNATDSEETESKLRHTYVSALLNLFWNGRAGVGVFRRLPGLLGICAAFLAETDPMVRTALLESVTNWGEYPVPLAQDAIQAGLALPDGFYQQSSEKLQDAATLYISRDEQNASHILRFLKNDSFQGSRLQFAFMLISTVLQANKNLETEQMQLLCDFFFTVSEAYLKWVYNPVLLQEENVHLLPGLHRFAWYILREQKRLGQQAWSDCIQDLRQALQSAPAMKHVVDYLLHQVDTQQANSRITPEMETLAAQIRSILSQYAPDDPAVQMLMASPAYQKVAPLLEMIEKSENSEDESI